MGLLDKVKNLFTEEVEVEEAELEEPKKKRKEKVEEPEEIQKEVIQVEIPSPTMTREELHSPVQEPKKEEYKFPFFDDNDFDTIDVTERKKEEEKPKEVYKPQKEEKKNFKPSPIISPVYGFLDKNYQKEEIAQSKTEYNPKKATVDEIRDRAYGSLESDIETTLFGNNRVLFDENEPKEVLDEEIKEETTSDEKEKYDSETIGEKPRHEKIKDDDLTELLEAEMTKPGKEKKQNRKPRKISDKELFNLIDSMYEKEIK